MSRTQEESGSGRRARPRSTPPETPPQAAPKRRKAASAAETRAEAGATHAAPIAEQRDRMIAEAAYYRAEQRGFLGDDDIRQQDWLEAEAEVDRMLAAASPPPSRGNGAA